MKSFISNVVLALGCWSLFTGIMLLSVPSSELAAGTTSSRWWGVFLGGAGLAITVREFAFRLGEHIRAPRVE